MRVSDILMLSMVIFTLFKGTVNADGATDVEKRKRITD